MRAFGHSAVDTTQTAVDAVRPVSLSEVTICGRPDQLREAAKFLNYVADAKDKHGEDFDHEHLRDWWQDWQPGFVDIIVFGDFKDSR